MPWVQFQALYWLLHKEFQVSPEYMISYLKIIIFVCLLFVFLEKTSADKNWDNVTECKCSNLLWNDTNQLHTTLFREKFKINATYWLQWQCQQQDNLFEDNALHLIAVYYYIFKMNKNRPLQVCMLSFLRSLGKLFKSNVNLMLMKQQSWDRRPSVILFTN